MKEQQEDFAIETRQLSKRYGRQLAVERVELHIPRGSIYGLLGPNGSGKTTTLKLLTRSVFAWVSNSSTQTP